MTLPQPLLIIFAIIFLGVICEKRKIFNSIQIESFELFLFKIAIPCYLFTVTLRYEFTSLIYLPYISSYLSSFMAISLIIIIYFIRYTSHANLCIRILCCGYVNAAIYTLPIITFLLENPESAVLGNLIQVVIIQPFFLILLGFLKHREKTLHQKLWSSIANPIVFMPIIGLVLNFLQLNPGIIITTVVQNLGASTSSLALFTFGLTLGSIRINKELVNKDVLLMVVAKNIIHPTMAFIIGNYIFRLNTYWLYSLIIATSAPTAYVIYLIAKQFSLEQNIVKMIIAVSSILSLIMLFFITWIFSL